MFRAVRYNNISDTREKFCIVVDDIHNVYRKSSVQVKFRRLPISCVFDVQPITDIVSRPRKILNLISMSVKPVYTLWTLDQNLCRHCLVYMFYCKTHHETLVQRCQWTNWKTINTIMWQGYYSITLIILRMNSFRTPCISFKNGCTTINLDSMNWIEFKLKHHSDDNFYCHRKSKEKRPWPSNNNHNSWPTLLQYSRWSDTNWDRPCHWRCSTNWKDTNRSR